MGRPPNPQPMHRLNLTLPNDLYRVLVREARARKLYISGLVAELVRKMERGDGK